MLNFSNFEYGVRGGYQYLKRYPAFTVEHVVNIFTVVVNVTFTKIGMQTWQEFILDFDREMINCE